MLGVSAESTPERRVTREVVQHVAHLARLKLSEDELVLFTSQLGDVLKSLSAIEELDTEGVEPTSHPYPQASVFREDDAPAPASHVAEGFSKKVLSEAPSEEEGQFRVPPVLLRDERSVPPHGEKSGE